MNLRSTFLLPVPVNLNSMWVQEAIPTVDQILDKYVRAIGGKAAVEKITSRVMKGSLVAPGGRALLEIYEKLPNKFLVIIDGPVSGMRQNGFNGTIAWSQQRNGIREMSGPQVENFKREHDLHREIKLKTFYPKLTCKGKERINDRETFVVEAAAADSIPETMYFDTQTGLLIRRDVTIQDVSLQAYFEDYREVDGIKLPFTIRRVRTDFSWTNKFDEVKHNVPIDESKFDMPTKQ